MLFKCVTCTFYVSNRDREEWDKQNVTDWSVTRPMYVLYNQRNVTYLREMLYVFWQQTFQLCTSISRFCYFRSMCHNLKCRSGLKFFLWPFLQPSPPFPLHIFHLSESTKTKFFHASVALDMSVLLYCSEVNASRLWTAEMTNAPRYVPLQEVDRQREMERNQPVFNISSQMGVQQMTCRSCRHETPAAAASQLAVVNIKTTE